MPSGELSPQRRASDPRPPVSPAARAVKRAERLAVKGKPFEAIATLDTAMSLGADRYTCYLRQSRLYQEQRRLNEAVLAAEKAIAESPARLLAYEAIITLYLESRDYARVIDASKALLKIAPRHLPARDAMGAAYVGMGDVEAAMRVVNEQIRLDPTNPTHRFTKAHLCQHRGEIRLAVEEFERVLELSRDEEAMETALEHLEALDSFQIDQILALSMEDTVFRLKLQRDAGEASRERSFFLSKMGVLALSEIVESDFDDGEPATPWRTSTYH